MRKSKIKRIIEIGREIQEGLQKGLQEGTAVHNEMRDIIHDRLATPDAEAEMDNVSRYENAIECAEDEIRKLAPAGYARSIIYESRRLSETRGVPYLDYLDKDVMLLRKGTDPYVLMMEIADLVYGPPYIVTEENRCVCCGDIIPEGLQVCWRCEHEEGRNAKD